MGDTLKGYEHDFHKESWKKSEFVVVPITIKQKGTQPRFEPECIPIHSKGQCKGFVTVPYLSCELWRKPRGSSSLDGRATTATFSDIAQGHADNLLSPLPISIDKSMIGNMEEEG